MPSSDFENLQFPRLSRGFPVQFGIIRFPAFWRLCRARPKRHCYGTHLLEAGVSLRIIQANLGHTSPNTTALYTHLTAPALALLRDPLNALMRGL